MGRSVCGGWEGPGAENEVMRRLLLAAVLGALVLGTAACAPAAGSRAGDSSALPSAAASGRPVSAAPSATSTAFPTPAHVVIVVEENHSSAQTSSMSYLRSLAKTGADFSNAHAETHPSEPNYLALWSGSTHGLTSDACPLDYGSSPNLGAQLIGSGRNAVAYAQGLPEAGSPACTAGAYARKHVPLADFAATSDARHLLPFSAFPTDFNTL